MGCGSSQPGAVITSSNVQTQRTVVIAGNQPVHYTGSQAVQRVQTYPIAQNQHGAPPVYPGARQPYPTQTRGYVQQGVPHTTVVQQPVVYQDRGSDVIVGMAAGAMMANAMHGHHHHGYHGYHDYHGYNHGYHDTHIHGHDHFHNSEHHGGYDGGGGGFDGGYNGAVEGGGFDGGYNGAVEGGGDGGFDGGGGFDDGGGGFDDGGGFDGGDFD